MAVDPKKISAMTQTQRNAIIAALGCKTIFTIDDGDSLPTGFTPDELIVCTGVIDVNFNGSEGNPYLQINIPYGYYPVSVEAKSIDNIDPLIILDADENEISTPRAINPKGVLFLWNTTGALSSIPATYFEAVSPYILASCTNVDTHIELFVKCIKAN